MTGGRRPPPGFPEILAAAGGAASVLDVGCGSGRLAVELAGAASAVTGIDVSEERLARGVVPGGPCRHRGLGAGRGEPLVRAAPRGRGGGARHRAGRVRAGVRRLGDLDELIELHRRAGLHATGTVIRDELRPPSAADHWRELTAGIGHFARLAETLSPAEEEAVVAELEHRVGPAGGIRLARSLVLVSALR